MTTTVKQLLKTKPAGIISITSSAKIFDAIKLMADKKVGALPVIDDNRLVGVVSERDYTRKVAINQLNSHSANVAEIMTRNVITVNPSNTIDECMQIMSDKHIRHLPVTENGEIVGVLSIMDVVRNILAEKESLIEQLEHYITESA